MLFRSGQLGGPTDAAGLLTWFAAALSALTAATMLTRRRDPRRRAIAFAGVLLVTVAVEIYTTWAGDPVELARHMVGADQRLVTALIVAIAIGTDIIVAAWRDSARSGSDVGDDEPGPIEDGTATPEKTPLSTGPVVGD